MSTETKQEATVAPEDVTRGSGDVLSHFRIFCRQSRGTFFYDAAARGVSESKTSYLNDAGGEPVSLSLLRETAASFAGLPSIFKVSPSRFLFAQSKHTSMSFSPHNI